MRTLHAVTLCAVVGLSFAACGESLLDDDNGVVTEGSDTFDAVRFEFENATGETFDLVDEGGRFELVLDREEGTFDSDFVFGDTDFQLTGTFEAQPDQIVFSDDPFQDDDRVLETTFEFQDDGDIIILRDREAAFDVDGDGSDELAELEIRLERRN